MRLNCMGFPPLLFYHHSVHTVPSSLKVNDVSKYLKTAFHASMPRHYFTWIVWFRLFMQLDVCSR